ncbi:hypothetical protein, partial [Candidatus Villigracilis affinis]|uniref:hypothetical protein n=1 Tax=Candidatus Villigracilis affinis TaxID=3140682 RepID=UPI001D9E42B9|nr:hypothetical protein [Anaerolineales bacterium]
SAFAARCVWLENAERGCFRVDRFYPSRIHWVIFCIDKTANGYCNDSLLAGKGISTKGKLKQAFRTFMPVTIALALSFLLFEIVAVRQTADLLVSFLGTRFMALGYSIGVVYWRLPAETYATILRWQHLLSFRLIWLIIRMGKRSGWINRHTDFEFMIAVGQWFERLFKALGFT